MKLLATILLIAAAGSLLLAPSQSALSQGSGSPPSVPAQYRWEDPNVWRSPPISFWVSPIQDQITPVLTVPIGKKFLLRRTNTDIPDGPQPLLAEIVRPGGQTFAALRLGCDGQAEQSSFTLGTIVVRTEQTLGLGLVIGEGESLQITDPSLAITSMGNWVFTGEWISAALPIETVFSQTGGVGSWTIAYQVSNPSGVILAAYGAASPGASGFTCHYQIKDDQGVVRLTLPPVYQSYDLQAERTWFFLQSGWSIEAMPITASGQVWFTVVDL